MPWLTIDGVVLPVAGVGQQHPRLVGHTGRTELLAGGLEDRLQVRGVE
jgi:hypothetical protein